MNYLDIQNEILSIRFQEGDRSRIKNWINSRYQEVWGIDDWHFKHVQPVSLAVVSGNTNPVMPADYSRTDGLWDDLGGALSYRSPWEFMDVAQANGAAGVSARPDSYTVLNHQIILDPVPNTNYTFKIAYKRSVSHLNSGGAIVPGLLSADSDLPIWEEGYHYLLVIGAMSLGLRLNNDPSYQPIEQEFAQKMGAMREQLLPPDRQGNLQYGRDEL